MFPALLVATQVYTVVWGDVVGTIQISGGLLLVAEPFTYHCTVGRGSPSAEQYSVNLTPTVTLCVDCEGSIETEGGSVFTHKDSYWLQKLTS